MADFLESNLLKPSISPEFVFHHTNKGNININSTVNNMKENEMMKIEKDFDFSVALNKLRYYLKISKYSQLAEEGFLAEEQEEDYLRPLDYDDVTSQICSSSTEASNYNEGCISESSLADYPRNINPGMKNRIQNFKFQICAKLLLAIKQKSRDIFHKSDETTEALLSDSGLSFGLVNQKKCIISKTFSEAGKKLTIPSAFTISKKALKSSKKKAKKSLQESCRHLALAYTLLNLSPLMPDMKCDITRRAYHYDPCYVQKDPIQSFF